VAVENAGPKGVGAAARRFYDESVLDEAPRRPAPAGLVGLTPRELEVLEVISLGLTNAEAAQRLSVSVHAIKFHLAAIYDRLGVSNRTEAAVTYLRAASAANGNGVRD
jgi:DNA-binding NarL/FixJ family response regulator